MGNFTTWPVFSSALSAKAAPGNPTCAIMGPSCMYMETLKTPYSLTTKSLAQANQEIMELQDAAFRQTTAAWQATMAASAGTRAETERIGAQIAAQRAQLEALQGALRTRGAGASSGAGGGAGSGAAAAPAAGGAAAAAPITPHEASLRATPPVTFLHACWVDGAPPIVACIS